MVGIVVVSHSPSLARAAVGLALEMVGDNPPPIAIAAGAGEGVTGTDAVRVAAAIDEVASEKGVLVVMDLGSAVLSGTMALEFASTPHPVRLSDAPFVEGLLAAVVLAGAGASLDEVEREARRALDSKRAQLGGEDAPAEATTAPPAAPPPAAEATAEVTLINPDGLHSRPAATVVKTVAGFDAVVTIENVSASKAPVSAASLIGIMALGAKEGDVVRFSATGPDAAAAVDELRAMAEEGFGEVAPG